MLLHEKFRRTENGRLPMPLPPNNIYFYHTLGQKATFFFKHLHKLWFHSRIAQLERRCKVL
jgi:hypothetical protein